MGRGALGPALDVIAGQRERDKERMREREKMVTCDHRTANITDL